MEEALELADYLPMSYRSRSEEEYIAFLWDAFQTNYSTGKFEFSSLAFHLLYMSFVSFSLWQIRVVRPADFTTALIGFQREKESKILRVDNPFKFYEELKESEVFRFLKLLGCENDQVGEFSRFVKRRNKIAHPTGTVFFNDQVSIDKEISEMMREVGNIQNHMRPIILEVYRRFLMESWDIENRQYAEPIQEIVVNLLHKYYLSPRDIRFCLELDMTALVENAAFPMIESLHTIFAETYADAIS